MADDARGIEHPLHHLLEHEPERGRERLWAAFEVSDYSMVRAARVLGVQYLSLYRWLRKFDLLEEFEARKRVNAARVIDARIGEQK